MALKLTSRNLTLKLPQALKEFQAAIRDCPPDGARVSQPEGRSPRGEDMTRGYQLPQAAHPQSLGAGQQGGRTKYAILSTQICMSVLYTRAV